MEVLQNSSEAMNRTVPGKHLQCSFFTNSRVSRSNLTAKAKASSFTVGFTYHFLFIEMFQSDGVMSFTGSARLGWNYVVIIR